jgi:hypothetical protein
MDSLSMTMIGIRSQQPQNWYGLSFASLPILTFQAVTIFPIAFAAVVGRATKAYASWRLERGVPLGFIEQLLGSQTFFGTFTTQFFMRSYNLVGLGLLLFWCLSPLGGQSSLRIITTSYSPILSNASILYFNTRAESPFAASGDMQAILPALNALYLSSLMAPESVKISNMDLWGNVKIPRLADIQSEPDSNGWRDVSPANSSYNSLIGVPISGVPTGRNTTFNLESSYFDLEAINATFGPEMYINTTSVPPGQNFGGTYFGSNGTASCTACSISFQIGIDHFANYNWTEGYPEGLMNNSIPYFGGPEGGGPTQQGTKLVLDERPPHILFQSRFWGELAGEAETASSRVIFRLQQIYVESTIKCDTTTSQPNCSVISIRPSKQSHPPASITSLSFELAIYNFAGSLATADGVGHEGFSSTTELFIVNPATPLQTNQEEGLRIWEIPLPTLSLRLTQIFNAYWQGSINSGSMVGDMASAPFATEEGPPANLTSPAQSTALELTYVCDWGWLSIFLLSTVALLVGAVAGVILDHISIGPDILGYASSLTRDSPYVRLPRGGSTLGGFERARLLRSMEVRLGDVRSESDEGYVVFGSDGLTGRMMKGRYYD